MSPRARALTSWLFAASLISIPAFASPLAVNDVVTKALDFKALLSSSQQSTLEQGFTNTLAVKWSNLPCGASCRNGVQFSALTAPQVDAAMEVITAASGLSPNEGVDEFVQTRVADSVLNASGGGSNYGSGIFFIAFLNTPTSTGAWMLQFGGHHFAVNIAFNKGRVVGLTPDFKGVEPLSFPAAGYGTLAPLNQEQAALVAMFDSLTPTQLAAANAGATFTDLVMGAGKDSPFPTAKLGLSAATLNASQRAAVLAAMDPYILDMDSASAATIRAIYASELDQTYIAWSGASSKMTAKNDYARIDGPSVWIEFTCQGGIVIKNQIHYHTIWRDRTRDYGNYLAATSLSGTTATRSGATSARAVASLAANVNAGRLRLTLAEAMHGATVTILDMEGRPVLIKKNVTGARPEIEVMRLGSGTFTVKVEQKRRTLSARFVKL